METATPMGRDSADGPCPPAPRPPGWPAGGPRTRRRQSHPYPAGYTGCGPRRPVTIGAWA